MYQPSVATKPTSADWIGDIPANWGVMRLKFVAALAYGDSLPAESRKEGEIHVYGSNGVVGTNDKANTDGKTIIVGRKGSFGKLNLSDESVFAIDTTYFVDHHFTKHNIEWLYYLLCCLELDSFSRDFAVPGLAREDAYVRWCPVPPECEQRAIVTYLKRKVARIDALITKKHRLLELVEEKRLSIITHAVTKGLNSSVPMKDSGIDWLGQIPAHWKVQSLRRLLRADTRNGLYKPTDHFSSEGVPFLQMGEAFAEPIFCGPATDRVSATEQELKTWGIEKGDLIFARRSLVFEGSGKCSLVGDISEPHLLESSMIRVRLLTYVLNPEYALQFFRSCFSRATVLAQTKQVTISGIDSQQLKASPVVVPPLLEQATLLEMLRDTTNALDLVRQKIDLSCQQLREYRSALITNAVTGKIDVRRLEQQEAAE